MLPNLYLIGAAKSATTSLSKHISISNSHVFAPTNKEPNYFVFSSGSLDLSNVKGPASPESLKNILHKSSVSKTNDYKKLYDQSEARWRLDASVRYMYYTKCAKAIKNATDSFPECKILACLRKPSSRAISHFIMMKEYYNLEPLSFPQAILAEEERIKDGWDYDWHYLKCGEYSQQLNEYINIFGRDNVHILFYENLVKNPFKETAKIFKFLNIPKLQLLRAATIRLAHEKKKIKNNSPRFDNLPSESRDKLINLDQAQKTYLYDLCEGDMPW